MIRLLILDVSGMYTYIYDEMYINENEVEDIRNKYDLNKFVVLKIQ